MFRFAAKENENETRRISAGDLTTSYSRKNKPRIPTNERQKVWKRREEFLLLEEANQERRYSSLRNLTNDIMFTSKNAWKWI